jgi:hypothetical protein
MNLSPNGLTIVQAFEALLTGQAHAFTAQQLSELEALVADYPELNLLEDPLAIWQQKNPDINDQVLALLNCPDLDRGLGAINPTLKPADLKNSQAALANAVRMAASSPKPQPQQHG